MCFRFNDKLRSARNYNPAFVVGSTNLRASAFKEHAASDMYLRAMTLLNKKSQGSTVVEYAPIAKMLSPLDEDAERNIKRKFEIAYNYTSSAKKLVFHKDGSSVRRHVERLFLA